jgi:hypothetical protein
MGTEKIEAMVDTLGFILLFWVLTDFGMFSSISVDAVEPVQTM